MGDSIVLDLVFVTSRALVFENIGYTIGVYQSADGFIAFCDCQECPEHNMKSEPVPDKDAAIEQCKELIRQHHSHFHCSA